MQAQAVVDTHLDGLSADRVKSSDGVITQQEGGEDMHGP